MGFGVLMLVFIVLLVLGGRRQITEIVLPESQTDSAAAGEDNADSRLNTVTINPETVGLAVGTLSRPSAYSRSQTVETYWSGGSGASVSQVYVSGGRTRLDTTLADGSVRHTLVADGPSGLRTLAGVWYDDETVWKRLDAADLTADIAGRMLTYETVRDLSPEDIALADYRYAFDANCIYVETRRDEAGYKECYWVNAGNGLLEAAERFQGEELVYRFSAGEPDISPQEESLFLLPDGSVLGAAE